MVDGFWRLGFRDFTALDGMEHELSEALDTDCSLI